jgi:membrane-associated protease RseP (regulator of RpoE activity)
LLGTLIVVVGMIVMITVHEAGHFLAAKAVDMKVTEFFFGFGPRLWSTRRGETEYGIKAFPVGGYVRIVGMNPYEEIDPEDRGRTYREKPFWAKSVVVLAGVVSHLVMAFVIYWVVLSFVGVETGEPTTEVAAVSATVEETGEASPAASAGIREGDVIVELGGVAVPTWDALVAEIAGRPGETVPVVVLRDGDRLVLTATLASVDDGEGGTRGWLGVGPAGELERVGPLRGVPESGVAVADAVRVSAQGMWDLFSNLGTLVKATVEGDQDTIDRNRPLSVVGLGRLGAETQRYGLSLTLELLALINVFVALFNFIPIYPLDGGHFAVALYEKIRGKEPDVRKLAPIAAAVVVFIVLLGVFALYLDIARPFRL